LLQSLLDRIQTFLNRDHKLVRHQMYSRSSSIPNLVHVFRELVLQAAGNPAKDANGNIIWDAMILHVSDRTRQLR
ncbi:MAG: hypothetical protein ACFE0J_25040, partial [Elainellaceae cyanobacterium]